MSTIAAQAVARAIAGETVVIDSYGHDVRSGYVIQGPSSAQVEWVTPDAAGTAAATHLLGELQPGQVLMIESLDPHTIAVEQAQRVSTEREAHHLSRLRGAEQFYDARTGETKNVPDTAWIVRTPATAIARALLGESRWTYLADPVGAHRPGETHQEGTAHAYHSREAAERAIRAAQQRGRTHAQHAEAVEVSA